MTVVSNPVSTPVDTLSEAIARLRSLTQCSLQAGWRYWDEDLPIAQATQPDTWHDWAIAPLNEKDHIAWTKGKYVRWLGQVITVPHDLAGYPLEGLTLRFAVTWWANKAELFVNGELVQEGDIFDCVTRVLLSEAVTPGDQFAIAIRLLSPGHDDGALVRSVCHYESPAPRNRVSSSLEGELAALSEQKPNFLTVEPSFIADELDILRLYLQTFAPEKLDFLNEAVTAIDWSSILLSPAPPTPHSPLPTPVRLSAHVEAHSLLPFDQTLAKLRDRLLPLSPLLKQRRIRLLGHAHLDMAWLWTVDETWKAAERTFESALKLQKDFPELSFCHSTPALYEWIEQNRPALFEQIRQAIADGWWEPVGGLWIEPELNLISGESIVRQVLYGQRYFQAKFGSINRMAWLPDSFGFTWQLPQILKQGGIDYFVTQKLRWNDTTKFPYEVFKWQAPDRTKIFSLMSAPIGEGIDPIKMATYACDWETKTGIPDILWLPGVGDHGGGPTRDMLEIARRWQRSPFFPQLEFSTALDYLQDLEANYEPDIAISLTVEAQRAIAQAQSIVNEPLTFTNESLILSDESSTFSNESLILSNEIATLTDKSLILADESLTLTDESLILTDESLLLVDKTPTLTDESQTLANESLSLTDESLILNDETPTLNHETQNSKLKTQNSKLPTPDSRLPTPDSLPTWNSDLYLEYHRGCYTTHADQKQWNRRCEQWLYSAELYASLATIAANAPYPKAELEAAWKKVLFNQFHDILPGSSITEVFDDTDKAWEEVEQVGRDLIERSLDTLTSQISLPPPPHPNARAIVVFNSCSWERTAIVSTDITQKHMSVEMLTEFEDHEQGRFYDWQICDLDGQVVEAPFCIFTKDASSYGWGLTFLAENIPALGYRSFWVYPHPKQRIGKLPIEDPVLENECLRVVVDRTTGELSSIFDKSNQREVLSGAGNQLQAFRDEGQYWDAWNIDPDYEDKPLQPAELLEVYCWRNSVRQNNSLTNSVLVSRKFGQSVFDQSYILEKGSPVLKIQTFVRDWQERHTLIKAAFPLNLEADYATYEIPCGVVQRSTKPETEAEKAQWEVPAMHWADLSNGNYGVSLLNDCKYGYDAKPNQLRLTLLRGSEFPDPDADKGHHSFTYALYPHAGDWKAAQTVRHGYELNMPLLATVIPANEDSSSRTLPPTASLLNLGADNLVLMAFKQSEDSPDEWVMRCYESHGEDAQLNFQSDLPLQLEERVDLLERSTDPQTTQGQTATVRPWEIASFKVHRNRVSSISIALASR